MPDDKLGRNVLAVSSTAAVSAKENLPLLLQRIDDNVDSFADVVCALSEDSLLCLGALVERILDESFSVGGLQGLESQGKFIGFRLQGSGQQRFHDRASTLQGLIKLLDIFATCSRQMGSSSASTANDLCDGTDDLASVEVLLFDHIIRHHADYCDFVSMMLRSTPTPLPIFERRESAIDFNSSIVDASTFAEDDFEAVEGDCSKEKFVYVRHLFADFLLTHVLL